jgi:hypothetical protein
MLKFKLENNTDCMYARPEVETLLATEDNCTEVMKKALSWPTEGATGAVAPCRRCSRKMIPDLQQAWLVWCFWNSGVTKR